MNILNKLLQENSNRYQIIGAVIGSFLGLLLLLLSIQFYMDLKKLTGSGGGDDDQFVILNKKVTFEVRGEKANFTNEEIESIENQPFINKIGTFTPNNYKVGAANRQLGFYTELFFESIPDEFLDVDIPSFKWEMGQETLPIILSRDYLALYNFGFAPSQGLPQIAPKALDYIDLEVIVRGKGKRKTFNGKIAGFSNRINSILVPQSFMEYTNNNFQDFEPKGFSRLIVAADNPYSDEFRNFLESNNYELSTGKLIGGEIASTIRSLITAVAIIGFLIVVLSVLVFILNYQLIISKSSRDIGLMLQLGYQRHQISDVLKKQLMQLFAWIIGLTIVFFVLSRLGIVYWFSQQGLELTAFHWIVPVAAVFFIGLFLFINNSNIQKSIHQLSS